MRVVLVADRRFALRERSLLSRLEVGLADEGVRVVRALPGGFEAPTASALSETVHFEDVGLPLSIRWRAGAAAKAILAVSGGEPPEAVHAFGGTVWSFALALAEALDAALLVETWRAGLARPLQLLAAKARPRRPVHALCPDQALATYIAREAPDAVVRHSPWGVYPKSEPRTPFAPGAAPAIMMTGPGIDRADFTTAFEAITTALRSRADALVFADALAAHRTDLWLTASKLGVRERLSLVDEMDVNRDLVIRGDLLVLPEARAEQRSLVLEAMGAGMPVLAAADPLNATLIDNKTAMLVPPGDLAAWTQRMEQILDNPAALLDLTNSAREFIRESHRPSRQVEAVLAAYHAAVGDDSIPFPA
ncbi:MAG: glycosyltransferase [Phycisphaerales bacterium]|nr:glycosyltransferase [Phycisphaerales bacterium]